MYILCIHTMKTEQRWSHTDSCSRKDVRQLNLDLNWDVVFFCSTFFMFVTWGAVIESCDVICRNDPHSNCSLNHMLFYFLEFFFYHLLYLFFSIIIFSHPLFLIFLKYFRILSCVRCDHMLDHFYFIYFYSLCLNLSVFTWSLILLLNVCVLL